MTLIIVFIVNYNPKETLKAWYINLMKDIGVIATKAIRDTRKKYKKAVKPLKQIKD